MHRRNDFSTYELSRARLKLADDLIFTPQQYDDRVFYHIEQPSRSRFFRIGWAEYTFISLLDGETSLAEALSRTAGALGRDAFAEADATSICAWLIEKDLARAVEAARSSKSNGNSTKSQKWSRWLNPFWMKLPLFHPDRFLDALLPWLGWLHSWPVLLLSVLCWFLAAVGIVLHWETFSQSSQGIFAPANWLWLGGAWLGLKFLHETSHALVCRRYGGPVPETGMILILFAPMAYVDVTSSWGFRSRWKRMHVAAAGMIAEFHVASLCVFWWLETDSPVVAQMLFTVIFMASLTTVLFNANPLMRFDGYYLLADLVNIPNLASNGSQYLKGIVSRWFLGTPTREIGWRGLKGLMVRGYGVLAFLWRIVVCVGLLLSASFLFHGAGLLLAGLGVLMWVCLPVGGAITTWAQHATRKPLLSLWLIVSLGLFVGVGVLVWDVIPWPGARQAHGIIEYAPLSVVRAEVAGFVDEVYVEDKQSVGKGDLLLRLRNDDLESKCRDLEIAIQQSIVKRRKHLNEDEIAMSQVEQENRDALKKRLAELRQQQDRLMIRAPQAGRVMARELSWLPDTYLKEGDPILEIGEPGNIELRVAISQPDIETYRSHLFQTVPIRLRSGATLKGNLVKLDPRATQMPPHPALCAPVGGPLAVKTDREQSDPKEQKLVEPHLKGTVQLDSRATTALDAGLIGGITLRNESDTLGRVAYRRLKKWLRDRRDLFEAESQAKR